MSKIYFYFLLHLYFTGNDKKKKTNPDMLLFPNVLEQAVTCVCFTFFLYSCGSLSLSLSRIPMTAKAMS